MAFIIHHLLYGEWNFELSSHLVLGGDWIDVIATAACDPADVPFLRSGKAPHHIVVTADLRGDSPAFQWFRFSLGTPSPWYFVGSDHRHPQEPMKVPRLFFVCAVLAGFSFAAETGPEPLPEPISNNAVAILRIHGEFQLFSLMGIGAKKSWDAVSNEAYEVDADTGKAYSIHAVPGTAGRIGAAAVGVGDRVVLMGGYVIYKGGGMPVPDVNIYEPGHDRWSRGADMPTPVGDAVIGVYRDRYIYVIGGRSSHGVVQDVQIYDLEKNRWVKGTSTQGTAVFGHAGAVVGNTIVYIDGAKTNPDGSSPRFVAADECWKGRIDHHDHTRIEWTKLPSHPGSAHYRIAGGASEREQMIYFSGGTDNPYDYTGIGYDGKPAQPSPVTFAYDLRSEKWETLNENTPNPTMDHRGLLVTNEGLVVIGGMEKDQQVTAKVTLLPKAKAK